MFPSLVFSHINFLLYEWLLICILSQTIYIILRTHNYNIKTFYILQISDPKREKRQMIIKNQMMSYSLIEISSSQCSMETKNKHLLILLQTQQIFNALCGLNGVYKDIAICMPHIILTGARVECKNFLISLYSYIHLSIT